jgi:electron transport complex protein RnfD
MTKLAVDGTASASSAELPGLWEVFKGPMGGYIGEASVLALLIGGLYLLVRRVITPRIPVAYLGTVFVLSWVLSEEGFLKGDPVRGVLSGAIVLGALFMATDHSTSPTTSVGQYIMGIGCGILTVIFKVYGYNPEGFVYAILILNLLVPFIEKWTTPHKAVGVK